MNDSIPQSRWSGTDGPPGAPLGMTRNEFLARIRDSLSTKDADPPPLSSDSAPAIDDHLVRLCSNDEDLITRFTQSAEAVGMNVMRCDSQSLTTTIDQSLVELKVKRAVASIEDESLREAILDSSKTPRATEVVDSSNIERFDEQFNFDVGITDVDAAIADSGSLVYSSGPNRSRGTFLVPPVHLAIVRASQIVPDLIDYWGDEKRSDELRRSAATVLITGPSKTADIEGVLVSGMHGPGEVRILILTDCWVSSS